VYGTRHEEYTGLRIRDLESGEERWLAYPVQRDDQESRATLDVLPGMSFTPDSEFLVASWGGKIWKVPTGDRGGDAVAIPFRVSYDLAVGPKVDFDYPIEDTPTFMVRQIRDAVPSPDGTHIAFTALDRLWVASADGSGAHRVTDQDVSEHFPAWSPDGQWVAYATWEGDSGHLYRARWNGRGEPERVTVEPGVWVTPAWSPDGDRIVALRGYASTYQESQGGFGGSSPSPTEIVWVPAGGGPSVATLIAPTDGRRDPHFGERADRIYLHDASDDVLVSIRWDGTDERQHVRVSGPRPPGAESGLDPDLLRMAPRGDQALALIEGQIYTVTVPRVGAEAPTINVANPRRATFPARHLTDMGGEFPSWSGDGGSVHWSLGNAFFTYDLAVADAAEEAAEAARGADQEEGGEADEDAYAPTEVRVAIEAERDIPQATAVLRGARVITMRGDEVIENADIVVRDNRIAAIGARGSVNVPSDARVIDVSGRTIVPGFVDTHAHMRPAGRLHRSDVWPYLANLAFGVTTTRDPQTGTTDVLSYSDQVRAGHLVGPRIYSTGPGVFWQHDIDSAEKAHDILSKYSDYFDTNTIKMYVAGTRRGRQLIIDAARELELMPTTEGSLNIRQNLTETIDGYPGLEHSLPIYPLYGDVVRLFVEQGRTYTPTLLVSYGGPWAENYYYSRENPHDDAKLRRFVPHEVVDAATLRRGQWFREDQHVFADHARFVRDLVEAGGRAGVGSHGQLQGLGYHWELWAMQSGGLKNHDALRVATILGAEAIGLDGDVGSLAPGKMADLVVLEANPLDDIRNTNRIESVMVNGRLYDADTLDETYPRQRALERLWWWDDEPTGVPGVGVEGR
jgi:imidazolonepropionase-like amidohydrolase